VAEGWSVELTGASPGAAQMMPPEECLEEKWYAVYSPSQDAKAEAFRNRDTSVPISA
jgi:hypothetical protein